MNLLGKQKNLSEKIRVMRPEWIHFSVGIMTGGGKHSKGGGQSGCGPGKVGVVDARQSCFIAQLNF